jgi:hypothetical protein
MLLWGVSFTKRLDVGSDILSEGTLWASLNILPELEIILYPQLGVVFKNQNLRKIR